MSEKVLGGLSAAGVRSLVLAYRQGRINTIADISYRTVLHESRLSVDARLSWKKSRLESKLSCIATLINVELMQFAALLLTVKLVYLCMAPLAMLEVRRGISLVFIMRISTGIAKAAKPICLPREALSPPLRCWRHLSVIASPGLCFSRCHELSIGEGVN